jgi:hypothetical protein
MTRSPGLSSRVPSFSFLECDRMGGGRKGGREAIVINRDVMNGTYLCHLITNFPCLPSRQSKQQHQKTSRPRDLETSRQRPKPSESTSLETSSAVSNREATSHISLSIHSARPTQLLNHSKSGQPSTTNLKPIPELLMVRVVQVI